jgi:hypothetical protein
MAGRDLPYAAISSKSSKARLAINRNYIGRNQDKYGASKAMENREIERLVANNVSETVWLRLRRLTSAQLCEQLLSNRSTSTRIEVLRKKSIGMSSAIRSALGYWDTREGGLNSRILSRYYALLQITIAEQISSLENDDDLAAVQRHTEYGHGLFSTAESGKKPTSSYHLGCLKSGHFAAYIKSLGIDMTPYANDRRPKKFADAEVGKLVSLSDLLRRVPELQDIIEEYIGLTPLSFHIGHDSKNFIERAERMQSHSQRTGRVLFDPPQEGLNEKTYVAIYAKSESVTAEDLGSFCSDIKNIQLVPANQKTHADERFVGEILHPKGTIWWDFVETYKSGYSGTSIISPFWGTRDPFVLHFVILYAFSILARYLPETWHSIENGDNDNVRALLEHYLVIVDNVLPHIAVERLTRKRLLVTQPGSLNAPI